MSAERKRFSVKTKMYIFVVVTVLSVAVGTSLISYSLSIDQLDHYYKQSAADNARNIASSIDGDFIAELIPIIKTDEYQWLRTRAEEEGNEQLIEDYLIENGVWEQYEEMRSHITDYVENMDSIERIAVVAHGGSNMDYDMYLVIDGKTPIYKTGFYEIRALEMRGKDITNLKEPVISDGTWGWACTDYKPVCDSHGNIVCVVECDYGLEDVMAERSSMLISLMIGSVLFTTIILGVAVWLINGILIKPIRAMTDEMKKFKPSEKNGYDSAGVMKLNILSNDEIGDIYHGIRNMQKDILDYLKAKTKAENDIRNKNNRIGQLSNETNMDPLTGVGSKSAYIKKISELNRKLASRELREIAFIFIDMNNLKYVNDTFGHKAGDHYIKGCCDMVGNVFRNSLVYRIGGDEFVAILTDEDYEDRRALVEKLKSDYEESYDRQDVEPWERYSSAVGLAELTSEDKTLEPVFKRADKAMYEDKALFKKNNGTYR